MRRGRRLGLVGGVGIRLEAGREEQVRWTVVTAWLPAHGAEAGHAPRAVVARRGGHCKGVGLTHKELWSILERC